MKSEIHNLGGAGCPALVSLRRDMTGLFLARRSVSRRFVTPLDVGDDGTIVGSAQIYEVDLNRGVRET
jgi:hypothetical protein